MLFGRAILLTGLLVALASGSSCERSKAAPGGELTPRETIEQLWKLRARREYTQMEPYILPPHARTVSDLLAACDSFLLAEQQLREYVRDNIGYGVSQTVDLSAMAYNLEVFSRAVELLDEAIDGERAIVSFTINRQIPTKTAQLVLRGGAWRYDPGTTLNADLPRVFRMLADGVRKTLQELRDGVLSADAVRASPAQLARRLQSNLTPALRLLGDAPSRGAYDQDSQTP